MSLATCKTCGGKVSDTAGKCPHCGAVRTKSTTKFLAFLIVAGLGVYIYGLLTAPAPVPTPVPVETAAEKARNMHLAVGSLVLGVWRKNLNDPASAQLSQALLMDDGSLCMTVRARNGFNAIMPASLVVEPNGKAHISEEQDKTAFRHAWNTFCGDKRGTDETRLLRLMTKL